MKKILTTAIVLIMFTMMLCSCASKKKTDISDDKMQPKLSESEPKKTTKPSAKPTTKPSAKPTTKSATEPSTKPSVKASTEPSTAPTAEPDEPLPKELVGLWEGTGEPEGGGSPIKLRVTVNADATGEYTFEQAGYKESYPFTLEKKSGSFTVNIPANNKLGISNCGGTYEYTNGTLTLHIKTDFSSGRSFKYTAACTKKDESQADNPPAEANVDIAAAVEHIINNESIDGMKPGLGTSDITAKLGEEDDFPAVIMENMQMFYFSQGYIISYLNSNKIVTVVSAMPPAAGKTARGIGIGSTEDEVRTAYGDGINTELSKEGTIVFGDETASIDFIFENGFVKIINLSY
ncbi:MAG TPA: hypothetical protein GXZ76_03550 [Clostridiaceae bacterium]|jgi:hypothetical protein|nr:hypothetical protein [Clostridiaceae bacterium]